MLTTVGKLVLDDTGFRVILDHDFVNYYKKLIDMFFYKTRPLFTPRHGAHVSIVLKSLHPNQFRSSKDVLRKYHGRKVVVKYDPYIVLGGKSFTNYFMKVDFPLGEEIKSECGIYERSFFHVTICSDKHLLKP